MRASFELQPLERIDPRRFETPDVLRKLAAAGRPDGNGRTGRIVSVRYLVKEALLEVKHRVRSNFKFYSQDLIKHLFAQPYTRVAHLIEDLGVSRLVSILAASP